MTSSKRKRRPFNGSRDDHEATQLLNALTTDPADGTTYAWPATPDVVRFEGASAIGQPDGGVLHVAIARATVDPRPPAPPAPPAFPALPAAPQPAPVLPPVEITETAAIGDYLRLPVIWCEMPSCISWYHDTGSLGERDTRERALARRWRIDALGRLACPDCQQSRSDYWTPRPVRVQHPGVRRRWREHGTLPTEETQDRLEAEAAYARRVSREHPDWARAMAGATHRTAGAS